MNRPYFPIRLFWRFFVHQLLIVNALFLISLGIASYLFDFPFYESKSYLLILLFFVLSVLTSVWFAYRFAKPLQRVILKALRLANRKQFSDQLENEDILEEEAGEYFELELALDKIRKKMKKRRLQLAHEREESEALMRSLEDAIVSIGLDEKVKFYNARFATQFLKPSTEAANLTQIFREPEILDLFHKTLQTKQTQYRKMRLQIELDSLPRYFSISVSPLLEEKTREIYGALGLFHDVTDMKRAEQIRMEFVENASHELRTPLTSIKGFVDTLKEDLQAGRPEQADYFLKIISKSVDRLTELVSDMLSLSALESSSPLNRGTVDPQVMTQELLESLSNLISEKNILVKTQITAPAFSADAAKVAQVLQNLLSNAIKYIQASGQIEVRWESTDKDTVLRVIDNGPGIAEEHLPRLFERFYRIDKGRSREVGGTGLGLAIVKHVMQSHGGSVSVKSQLGQGSEFVCTFPKS